jgi:hypothetical protein
MRPNEFNIMFYVVRVFQHWLIDMYVKASDARASEVGRLIVLPKNFNGGEHNFRAQFLDAMTLVIQFGKPDYFVTMTCNPYWKQVGRELFPG